MQKIAENSSNISPIDKIKEKIDNEILTSDIADIVEVTYAYKELNDGTNFNTTLFSKLLGTKSSNIIDDINGYNTGFYNSKKFNGKKGKGTLKKESFHHKKLHYLNDIIKKEATYNLESKISDIDTVLDDLNSVENLNEDEKNKQELLISSLKYARNNLEIALVGLPFELEKAGLPLDMKDEEIEEKVKKIEDLEYENFGGKISENPEEMGLIYNFMKSNFDDFKSNLSSEEQEEYKKYLLKIKEKLGEDFEYEKPEENEKTHPALNLEMGRDDYKQIFEAIPQIMSSDKEVKVSNEYGSFYDGDMWYIPGNKDYENKTLNYILSTAVHEAFHLTTEMLGEGNVGGVKGGGFLEREEGMAVYLEYLIKGEKSLVGLGEPRLLVGELFEGKQTERFIELHNKLNPARKSGNILRNKRNYPLNYKGAQHKDSSYGRGLRQIKKILEGKNPDNISKKSLFMGKMNFDFLKKHGNKYKADIPKKIVYPFIMAEMMKFYSMKYYDSKKQAANNTNYNGGKYKFDGNEFKNYMIKNYSSIDLEGLIIKDDEFRIERNESKKRIGGIINKTKKKIKNIIDKEFENKKVA